MHIALSGMFAAQGQTTKHTWWILDRTHWNLWSETVFKQPPQDLVALGWPAARKKNADAPIPALVGADANHSHMEIDDAEPRVCIDVDDAAGDSANV